MTKTKKRSIPLEQELVIPSKDLILYNDNVNLFDFVVETLVDVCEHDPLQAEQCALVAHYKGKCSVKNGTSSELGPVRDELIRRGLTVSID